MSHNQPLDFRGHHTNADGDKSLHQTPRRPKPETTERLLHGTSSPAPATHSMMTGSKLSVNAREFVPRGAVGMSQTPPTSYPPPGLLLSPGAAEFFPRTDYSSIQPNVPPNMGPPLQMPTNAHDSAILEAFSHLNIMGMNPYPGAANQFPGGPSQFMEPPNHYPGAGGQYPGGGEAGLTEYLLQEFRNTMIVLTTLPGNIHDYLSPLCNKLRQATDSDILQKVIDVLYAQSVYEPNFRYTGARVVHFLCNELKKHPIFREFKQQFLNKCQQDYTDREQLLRSGPENVTTLCGLTMFMGELFLNVTAGTDGPTERLEFLPTVLTDLVLTLLSEPNDTTVKTACQLLKLAGGLTEDSMMRKSSVESQLFDNVFTMLNNLQSSSQISQNNKFLVKSVVKLRESNWGRQEARSANTVENQSRPSNHEETHHIPSVSHPHPEFQQPEPVFYDQSGKPISREEAGYPQEEEEDENPDDYVLTEEEERDFMRWQEENSIHEERLSAIQPHGGNPNGQDIYGEGFQDTQYTQWSTGESSFSNYNNYPQNYTYNSYPVCPDDEGLTMDDEAEKAYDEFLKSQRGPPM